jgi:tRNA(fMet)-specific endonuclease VapC
LDAFIAGLDLLPFDEDSARRYGQLRALLEKNGQMISDLDLQIACIALEAEAPLLTHNQQHFHRLVEIVGLAIVDWLA